MAKAFVMDICDIMDIAFYNISVETVPSLAPLYGIPQFTDIDPVSNTLIISEEFLKICIQKNGFTMLRVEVYAKVRTLHLLKNPALYKNKDVVMESLYYANALIALKGLQIPMPSEQKDYFFSNVQRVLKEEFNVEATFMRTPADPYNGAYFYKAHMSDACTQLYVNRYNPLPARSTVKPLRAGDKGTKENPFDNVYEAVEYIKQMEAEAHDADSLLRDIEQQKYFYDPVQGHFRIHWASPFVAQYKNRFPARAFFVNQMETRYFSFKPNLYQHKFLYRGQSDHYAGKPCVPNLYRSDKHNAARNYLEFIIFSQEMELLIQTHPLVRLLDRGIELLHDTFKFRMNYAGLTQHYYNKSHFLDLSSDIEVMKFFATTDYVGKTDTYKPHLDDSILGVIYCYELQYPTAFQEHRGYALKTIGKQMFMRPGAQCGYLLEMEKGVDLKTLPEVTAIFFRHVPEISEEIFQESRNGEEYFATDLLQHAWKDRLCARRDNRVVSIQTVKYNAKLNHTTPDDIISQLAAIGVNVDNFKLDFTSEELDMYYDDIKSGWWTKFCEDIHFYGAEDELYRQALKDIQFDSRYKWAFEK